MKKLVDNSVTKDEFKKLNDKIHVLPTAENLRDL